MEEQEALKIRIEQLKKKKAKKLVNPESSDRVFFDNLRDLVTLNTLEEKL